MGCWNHTCAITNLPIYVGEEVEVVLLKRKAGIDGASFCYATNYHSPLPLTFSGKYNEYGAVEFCEGVALETIVAALQKNLLEMEEGENEYHDIPAKKSEFNIDSLFELDHEGRLFIVNYKMQHDMREGIRIKHIVIRKEVYDGIIADMKFEKWDREKSEMYYIGYEDLVRECKQYTQDIDDIATLDPDNFRSRYWMNDGKIGGTMVGNMLSSSGMSDLGAEYPIPIAETLFNMRSAGHPDFDAVLDNALRLGMLKWFMDGARKSWVVPSGTGSQNADTGYQELCAKLTLSSAKIVKNYYGEDDE